MSFFSMRTLWSIKTILLLVISSIMASLPASAADNTIPGELSIHATPFSIGLEWPLTGDDNHDATCQVRYRVLGEGHWKSFLPLFRVDNGTANTLAGSILFLRPQTAYEIALLTYSAPAGVVVTGNFFYANHYAICLNHGGSDWTITDNTIIGDQIPGECSGDECFSGEGVELEHISGHVVAYNTISDVADGISYPGANCDIFGNELFDLADSTGGILSTP